MTTQTPHEARREAFAWLIEIPGAAYLGVRHLGKYEFFWTKDHARALRFFSEEQADMTMMAIREAEPNLFGFAGFLGDPRAIEHGWISKADAILADDPALVLVEMAKKALIEALALYDVATQAATFTRPRTGQVIVNVKRAEMVMAQLRPAIAALAAYQSTDKGGASSALPHKDPTHD